MRPNEKAGPAVGTAGDRRDEETAASASAGDDSTVSKNVQGVDTYSFRWGVPILDGGFTQIPNAFLDSYMRAGITRSEFLAVTHLARFRYETPGAQCSPSLETVARAMGYSIRNLRRIIAGLEERGLLRRCYRAGQATLYDFSGFSRAVLNVAQQAVDNSSAGADIQVTPDAGVRGTPDTHVRGGRTPTSHEEQRNKQTRTNDVVVPDKTQEMDRLIEIGVSEQVARELAATCEASDIEGWCDFAENASWVKNPPGLVVKMLRDGIEHPTQEKGIDYADERRRYIEGEYGDYIDS